LGFDMTKGVYNKIAIGDSDLINVRHGHDVEFGRAPGATGILPRRPSTQWQGLGKEEGEEAQRHPKFAGHDRSFINDINRAIADEIEDGATGYLIERALDEARSGQFRPILPPSS
jgi:hypothetical protein